MRVSLSCSGYVHSTIIANFKKKKRILSAKLCYDNFDQCKLLFTEWTEETTIKSLWFPEEEQTTVNSILYTKSRFHLLRGKLLLVNNLSRVPHTSEQISWTINHFCRIWKICNEFLGWQVCQAWFLTFQSKSLSFSILHLSTSRLFVGIMPRWCSSILQTSVNFFFPRVLAFCCGTCFSFVSK